MKTGSKSLDMKTGLILTQKGGFGLHILRDLLKHHYKIAVQLSGYGYGIAYKLLYMIS